MPDPLICREATGRARSLDRPECGRIARWMVRQVRGTAKWPMCGIHARPYIAEARRPSGGGHYSNPPGVAVDPLDTTV